MGAATIELEDRLRVDLHFDPLKVGVPCRQLGRLYERATRAVLPGGGTVRTLDPELALVLFLLHLTKDRFRYVLGYGRAPDRGAGGARLGRGDPVRPGAEGLLDPVALALEAVGTALGRPMPSWLGPGAFGTGCGQSPGGRRSGSEAGGSAPVEEAPSAAAPPGARPATGGPGQPLAGPGSLR